LAASDDALASTSFHWRPTALAVRSAEACGITLIEIARGSAFEIFSHPEGIRREQKADGESGFG